MAWILGYLWIGVGFGSRDVVDRMSGVATPIDGAVDGVR